MNYYGQEQYNTENFYQPHPAYQYQGYQEPQHLPFYNPQPIIEAPYFARPPQPLRGSFAGVRNSFIAPQPFPLPLPPYREVVYEDIPTETQVMEYQPVMKSVKDFYTVEKVKNMVPKVEYEQVMVPTWQPKLTYETVEQSYVHPPYSPLVGLRRSFAAFQQPPMDPYYQSQQSPMDPYQQYQQPPREQFQPYQSYQPNPHQNTPAVPNQYPQSNQYQPQTNDQQYVDRINSNQSLHRAPQPYVPMTDAPKPQPNNKTGIYHTLR